MYLVSTFKLTETLVGSGKDKDDIATVSSGNKGMPRNKSTQQSDKNVLDKSSNLFVVSKALKPHPLAFLSLLLSHVKLLQWAPRLWALGGTMQATSQPV